MDAKDLIRYFEGLGIEVHTTTKARGHQGFFLKNRIEKTSTDFLNKLSISFTMS